MSQKFKRKHEWQLVSNSIEYPHNSEKFYLTGVQGIYPATNFMDMKDVNLQLNEKYLKLSPRPRLCFKAC